jgi:hypothetical protein
MDCMATEALTREQLLCKFGCVGSSRKSSKVAALVRS